tara:strand:- start:3915 stop:4847 length:933 start_codon:yes stop_codon:yes gene_type:complete
MHHKEQVHVHAEGEGIFSFRVGTLDADGNETNVYAPAPPTRNLITDNGLERQGNNSDWLTRVYVGSGSTAPVFTDAAMANLVASTTTLQTSVSGAQSSAPFFAWIRVTRRFSAGAAAGNLSEVGIGWDSGLFSRALIRDGGGNPTTITVSAEQFLDVTYEYRFYPKLTDDTGSVVLTGSIGGTYSYIFRAANVNSDSSTFGWNMLSTGTAMGNTGVKNAFEGNIGAITAAPAGATSATLPFAAQAYAASSLQRKFTLSPALGDANFTAGIRSFLLHMGLGTFQIQFDPPIPKTSDMVLSLEFSHSWGRKA